MFRQAVSLVQRRTVHRSAGPHVSRAATKVVRLERHDEVELDRLPAQPKSQSNTSVTVRDDQSLAKTQQLSQLIKSPVQMDAVYEMNQQDPLAHHKKKVMWDLRQGITADAFNVLHRKYDISWTGFKRFLRFMIGLREIYNQRYIGRRHAILGPDLATAHFVVYRGGKVRFKHNPNDWITNCDQMPKVLDPRYQLIVVNASDTRLRWEAMDNLISLASLQELNLSKNKFLDDFVCDKLARLFRNSTSLTVLDLSDNPLITHRGVEALHRIRSLRRLVISGTKAAKYPFIELLIIMFNDVNPNCEIVIK